MPYQTKFELSHFEHLLATDFHPSALPATLARQASDDIVKAIKAEAGRIIMEFKHVICKGYEELHLERYIQMHERGTTLLMDLVHSYIQDGQHPNFPVYEQLMAALTRILDYIEKECCCYFNLNMPVPEHFRLISAEVLAKDALVVKAKMQSKGIGTALQQQVMAYLDQHCRKICCSYQQQKYARLFTESLLRLFSVNRDADWNRELLIELLYLNFNRSSFFTYCRRLIATQVDELNEVSLQRQKFYWFIKELQKLQVKPNVAYHSRRLGLTEMITAYIVAEIAYLDQRPAVLNGQPAQTFTERAEKFDFKLPLNLTVPQLALFVELFIRVAIFPVEKGKMMATMKFFAKNVITIGTTEVSAQSLNNKRRPDADTCKWMRDMLRKMGDTLEDLEGE